MQAPFSLSTLVECPRCGKHTIVQIREGVYQCLHCDFKRDLSEAGRSGSADTSSNPIPVFIGVLGFLATLVLFL